MRRPCLLSRWVRQLKRCQPKLLKPAPVAEPEAVVEVPAPDAAVEKPAETVEEPEFDLEPAGIVTPEALTQMVTDNPEFGKLLEADSRLKGQLYKTAREARGTKAIPGDLPRSRNRPRPRYLMQPRCNDVRQTFMGSHSRVKGH